MKSATFQKKYDLYLAIEDESVAGRNLNAPLKYNGVNVGKVRQSRRPGNQRGVSRGGADAERRGRRSEARHRDHAVAA